MDCRLTVGDATLDASLLETEAAAEFASLLPLTLTFEDFQGTEKTSDLPRELSTADAPAGLDPDVGDLTYYAPWGNLAIFYEEADYATGLVELGHIDTGIEALRNATGAFTVEIELVEAE